MFRGYLELDGVELANSSRVVDHLRPPMPTQDDAPTTITLVESPPGSGLYLTPPSYEIPVGSHLWDIPSGLVETPPGSGFWSISGSSGGVSNASESAFCNCSLKVGYDDTWTGLRSYLGDQAYRIENAPWYSPALPASAEFAGIWVMDVQGGDSVSVQREIAEMIGNGGQASPARDTTKELTVSALIVACTNAGARFGMNWLSSALRRANGRAGSNLTFFAAHPEDTAETADRLKRRYTNVVLTSAPTVSDLAGKGGGSRNRQASMFRVEFTLTALTPYAYTDPDVVTVNWGTQVVDPISWVHAPDCEDPSSCADLPVLFNADCVPERVIVAPSTIPVCGGCMPVSGVARRTFVLPSSLTFTEETAVVIQVLNLSAGPLTLNMWWQMPGSTEICDRRHPLQVSGLPVGTIAVADSVTGRPYAVQDGQRLRQVGIVSTPSGAPWTPMVIDRGLPWELVAESAPDATFHVELQLLDREP